MNHSCRVARVHGADSPTGAIDADHGWHFNRLPVDAHVEVSVNVLNAALAAEHRQPGRAHRGRCVGWSAPGRKCVAPDRSGGWWIIQLRRRWLIILGANRFRDDQESYQHYDPPYGDPRPSSTAPRARPSDHLASSEAGCFSPTCAAWLNAWLAFRHL